MTTMTIYQIGQDDLKEVVKSCLREAITEIRELPAKQEPPTRLNLRDAADFLEISKSKLYKLSMDSKIPVHHFGRRLVFFRRELIQWRDIQTKPKISYSDRATDQLAAEARKRN